MNKVNDLRSALALLESLPGKLLNVYCASSGGGKYIAVLQFKKSVPSDEGRQRQAALLAFSAFAELKHVFLVNEDVDCFDYEGRTVGHDHPIPGGQGSDLHSGRPVPPAGSLQPAGVRRRYPGPGRGLQGHF